MSNSRADALSLRGTRFTCGWMCRREWGVKVYDWHTQHSTIAGPEGLTSQLKRLMPIVGCEADAVAFEEETRQSLRALPEAAGEAKTVRAPLLTWDIATRNILTLDIL